MLGIVATSVAGFPFQRAMGVAATVGALVVVDALFVHPPTDGEN